MHLEGIDEVGIAFADGYAFQNLDTVDASFFSHLWSTGSINFHGLIYRLILGPFGNSEECNRR